MDTIATFEAKTHLTRLLDRVAAGEQITITHHGTPIARLVPAKPANSPQIRETPGCRGSVPARQADRKRESTH
jgi:prevent-host-death family protein